MFTPNSATGNPGAYVPTMPGYDSFLAQPFANMRTPQDQIHWIYGNMSAYLQNVDALQAVVNEVPEQLADLKKELTAYTDATAAGLRKLISELESSSLDWDTSTGTYQSSVEAHRALFNDVTVHGITTDTLANIDGMTVDSLADSGISVRGLAVYGGQLIDDDFPDVTPPRASGAEGTVHDLAHFNITDDGFFRRA